MTMQSRRLRGPEGVGGLRGLQPSLNLGSEKGSERGIENLLLPTHLDSKTYGRLCYGMLPNAHSPYTES